MKRLNLAVTIAAVALACLWFLEGYPTVIYDSWGYYYLSGILRTSGILAWPTDFRTYGYPLFLAIVTGFRDLPPEEFRLVVFAVQLLLYLGTCWFVSRKLARIFQSESLGALAFAVGALNPVLLLHTTEPLSDLLSAVLIQLGLALSWRRPAAGARTERTTIWQPMLSFFCAGAAVAVRPANVVVVQALVLVWVYRAYRWRDLRAASIGAAIAGLIPPFIPQLVINYRLSGRLNPLIMRSLYRTQTIWGMGWLKYGTVVIPDHSPFLVYVNTLSGTDPDPWSYLRHHPLRYLATLGLHAFAMLDYDLPFTYVTDLHPWYRWPLSLVNYGLLYLALAGCFLGIARVIRRRRIDEVGFALLSTVLVAASSVLVYAPVAVENRFGLTVEALMTPLIVMSLLRLSRANETRQGTRALMILGAPIYVLASVVLSAWISTKQANPFFPSPANAFVLNPQRAHLPKAPPTP
ncbi:MAG TPA: hypothetical protein VGL03_01205, partial [Thermoanaerobaculia bacterium]